MKSGFRRHRSHQYTPTSVRTGATSGKYESAAVLISIHVRDCSIFVHPLTKEEVYSSLIYGSFDKRLNFTPEEVRNFCHMPYIILKICSRDHEIRNAWIGPSFPLDLTKIPVTLPNVPLQYPSLSTSVILD